MKSGTLTFMNMSPFETTPLYIRIWGGDGENDQQSQQQEPKQEEASGSDDGSKDNTSGDAKESGGNSSDVDPLEDLEKKLADERKQRIKAQKELNKRDEDALKANADVEAERDDYKAKYEQLKRYVEKDAIETAIIKLSSQRDKDGNPKYDWHDIEAVATFIDKNNIQLDVDSGKIDGIDIELKQIAKDRPYLLRAKEEKQDQSNSGGNSGGAGSSPAAGSPASGAHPYGGTNRERVTDKNKLGSKYKIPGFGPGASATAIR